MAEAKHELPADFATKLEVPSDRLRLVCDPNKFEFETTAELPALAGLIGQQRAVRAMDFGLNIRRPGYNIYMAGLPGSGKTSYAANAAKQTAADEPVPGDWVYVHNFREPDRPLAIPLKPGQARTLRADMDELIDVLSEEIPKTLESDEFEQERRREIEAFQAETQALFSQLEVKATELGFQVRRAPVGFSTIPLKEDGEPMSQDEFSRLPPETRDEIEENNRAVRGHVADVMRRVAQAEKQLRRRLSAVKRSAVTDIVDTPIENLKQKYADNGRLLAFFDEVRADLLDNLPGVRADSAGESPEALPGASPRGGPTKTLGSGGPGRRGLFAANNPLARYRVNPIIDNSEGTGAPVVVESHPVYYNLIGRQEYAGSISTVNTDHTMIKAGALHRANGGYLILQARDLLRSGAAWEALKRSLATGAIHIEGLGEQQRLVPIRTIRPEPIPLNVKVILIGTPHLFHLLHRVDEDFRKLFKVKVDFDFEMDRNPETMQQYAMFISSVCHRQNLLHFDRCAVARVVEHASRLSGDQEKITTRFNEVVEIVYESDAWARVAGADVVAAEHVDKAIREKTYRGNRIEEKLQEQVARGRLLVSTTGAAVGQVNGLSVLQLDEYAFGRPSRITARTFLGEKGVINIEREAAMSGRIHDKGVLTLAGYLGGQYAQKQPLSVTASLSFEQLYEGIDGDSASSAELYALLSSLARVPLRQDLAVTGSVDQFGRIQPVGGVNEKIEGFFRACRERGLTGAQGVVIPAQNVANLVLDAEVVEAVDEGRFRVYAIETVDEGLQLLTGLPAGTTDDRGRFPAHTVHGRVQAQLDEFATIAAKRFGARAGKL